MQVSLQKPYIVIDQNICQRRQLVKDLFLRCDGEGLKVLLPDTAIFEFSKGAKPYHSWRRSLQHLSSRPDLVVAGRSLGQLMSEELATGSPSTEINDPLVTPRFQQLLRELEGGDDTGVNNALIEIAKILGPEKQLRENHAQNKDDLSSWVSVWRSILSETELKALRTDYEHAAPIVIGNVQNVGIIIEAAKNDGCSEESAFALATEPSAFSHCIYTRLTLAIDWLAHSGLTSSESSKVTNDFLDMDYVTSASFCHDLKTHDRRANRVYRTLMRSLDLRHESFEQLTASSRS